MATCPPALPAETGEKISSLLEPRTSSPPTPATNVWCTPTVRVHWPEAPNCCDGERCRRVRFSLLRLSAVAKKF